MAGKSSKPSFVWQGVLILLPVLLMAGFGTWAILRERKAVEQDTRQRAQEILQSLPYNFSLRVASRMGMQTSQSANESILPERASDLETAETDSTETWGAAGNLMPGSFTNALWTSLPGEVWPMNFLLATNGDVWDLTFHEAPQPPAWLGELDDKQKAAWAELRAADLNKAPATEVSKRFDDFITTAPPSGARECAEFVRLRANTAAQSDADAVKALLEFARNCTDVSVESGVPLSNLVLAEALRRSTPGSATAAMRRQLQFEVCHRPSLLSAELIDQAEHIAGSDAALIDLLHTLLGICDARDVQRALAEQIKLADVQRGADTITNVWLDALGQRWLCVLQPESVLRYQAETNGGTNQISSLFTNVFTEVIPYPKSFLTKSIEESMTEARMSMPDYFAVFSELEGESIVPEIFWRKGVDARQLNAIFDRALSQNHLPPQDILAEQEMALSLPASSSLQNAQGITEARNFEAMPSHPRFTLRILLIDRPLLYSRQRQRQLIFGALMAFSVAAALIGFIAARRAFTKQLGLSEAKSNFVSSVSHELRAPIASVRLMAESLERGKVADGAKQNEYYRFIVQECRRLSALIENVLDFSRIEQGRKQYEFEPTDVLALTRETVKLMEPYAEGKGVQLKLEISLAAPKRSEGGNIELEMDGRAIQQALVNLIDNAIKHSAKGQTVTIGLDTAQSASGAPPDSSPEALVDASVPVLLYVEDHGPGIPPAEHEKIFERFYRLGSELRRETQGVGIGLSIVRHIAAAHGGHVTVRSNIGEGSRFTIVLPVNIKPQMDADERR